MKRVVDIPLLQQKGVNCLSFDSVLSTSLKGLSAPTIHRVVAKCGSEGSRLELVFVAAGAWGWGLGAKVEGGGVGVGRSAGEKAIGPLRPKTPFTESSDSGSSINK